MSDYIDFFARLAEETAARKREFLQLGRVAGRFPAATTAHHGEIAVWCSNDYLGMGQHPEVLAAMKRAVDEYGAGSGGSRNIGGTNHYHVALEEELAALHGKEDAVLFTSGYSANEGALSVLAGRIDDCAVFSDRLNHASIIDGLRHSGAEKFIFRHNDRAHLEELLSSVAPERPKLVVTESVHSMRGDIAPLAGVAEAAERHGAVTFLDEVHAVGMYGPEGAGIAAREGLAGSFTLVMGTLAKGFGMTGGYVAGPTVLLDAVRAYARSFVFTTALPPAVAAGALAAVRHLRGSTRERERLAVNARLLHALLRERGIPFLSDRTHIVSALVGEDRLCKRMSALLLERHGIYVQAVDAPSVPAGEEILRIAPSAVHEPDEVRKFAAALDAVWSELDAPRDSAEREVARLP
ncbi:5-aminolevulinate synthase [Streptomyces sp. PsTaAH-124]|uniref:5-aminolevulinate synthase n=1 Tax=Streptomyces sp. PsTaAH-124 TaxID=1157638 RepID=UPI000362A2DC|nr:5-aminolevulinate synthase [Streptomyces sp. PsTaAH-124]